MLALRLERMVGWRAKQQPLVMQIKFPLFVFIVCWLQLTMQHGTRLAGWEIEHITDINHLLLGDSNRLVNNKVSLIWLS